MKITLAYFTEEDIAKLIEWIPDEKFLMQWAGLSLNYPLNRAQLMEELKGANTEFSTKYIYKVIHREDNIVIGHAQIFNLDHKNSSARLGRLLIGEPKYRGMGLGKELIKKLLDIAFNKMNLHRVELGVFSFNHAAIRCYQKAGFKIEGEFRDYRKFGNEYWNLIQMSILENEFNK